MIDFLEVRLETPQAALPELASFYLERLGLGGQQTDPPGLEAQVGGAQLRFVATEASAFYHFAFLVPGNRFHPAREWLHARARLLPDPETGNTDFDFSNWDAMACYCFDPAGNIVELIAHQGVAEASETRAEFGPEELVGFSELGLVGGDKERIAEALGRELGLDVWDGEIADPGRLAFVGERARTLILSPEGRPWLPTDRRAEVHPVEVTIRGAEERSVGLPGTPHRIGETRSGPRGAD